MADTPTNITNVLAKPTTKLLTLNICDFLFSQRGLFLEFDSYVL